MLMTLRHFFFFFLAALPAAAQRPDIVWMHGGHQDDGEIVTAFAGGQRIISAGYPDFTLKVWRVSDGTLLRTIVPFNQSFSGRTPFAVSPDGSQVAVSGADTDGFKTKFFRISDGALLAAVPRLSPTTDNAAYSPDSSVVAIGGYACPNNTAGVAIKNTGDWSSVWTICDPLAVWLEPWAFSVDGQSLLVMSSSGLLRRYPIGSSSYTGHGCYTDSPYPIGGSALPYLPMNGARTLAAYINGAGTRILSVPGTCSPNTQAQPVFSTASDHSAAFSPDGLVLATGGQSVSVGLWQTGAWSPITTFNSEISGQLTRASVAFSPDSSTVAASASQIKLWNAADGAYVRTLTDGAGPANSVSFSPYGQLVLSGYSGSQDSTNSTLYIRRTSDGSLVSKFRPSTVAGNSDVLSAVLSPDGQTIAVATGNFNGAYEVKLIQALTGALIRTITQTCAGPVAFSPDGATLYVGNPSYYSNCGLRAYDIATGTYLRTLGNAQYSFFALSGDGKTIATAGYPSIYVSRVSDGALLGQFNYPYFGPSSVALSQDGKYLAAGGSGIVHVWRVTDGAHLLSLQFAPYQNSNDEVKSIQFSPDGQTLAAGALDSLVRIWRLSDGALLQTYDQETGWGQAGPSNAGGITSIAYSPDAGTMAWTRYDGVTVVARNPFVVYPAKLTTAVSPAGAGTIFPATGTYSPGSTVAITAVASPGYVFTGFSGALSGTASPQTLTVNSDAAVTANFAPLQPSLAASVGVRTDGPVANSRNVPITLLNSGLGAAGNATITSITGITVLAGSGAVGVLTGTPANLGAISSGNSASGAILFDWPSTATRVRFTVNFKADGGYSGSTVITSFR
jgi:WD40 repeat protein